MKYANATLVHITMQYGTNGFWMNINDDNEKICGAITFDIQFINEMILLLFYTLI